jgi:hypothetical protein
MDSLFSIVSLDLIPWTLSSIMHSTSKKAQAHALLLD